MSIQTIRDKVTLDVKYNWTPDLPILRYLGGSIPVFLWDDLTTLSLLKEVLDDIGTFSQHVHTQSTVAYTLNKYVPFYNLKESNSSYACYCLEDEKDLDFFDLPDYTIDEARLVRGKTYYMSLEAIRALDLYYENESQFNRVVIDVRDKFTTDKSKKFYTWMNDMDQLGKDDLDASFNIKLRDDIDLTSFATEQNQAYTYGGKHDV